MQVRLEPALGFVIGVRNVVANDWTLAGNLANLGHGELHWDGLDHLQNRPPQKNGLIKIKGRFIPEKRPPNKSKSWAAELTQHRLEHDFVNWLIKRWQDHA